MILDGGVFQFPAKRSGGKSEISNFVVIYGIPISCLSICS